MRDIFEARQEVCNKCGAVVPPEALTENGCYSCDETIGCDLNELADRSKLSPEDVDDFAQGY